MGHVAHPAAAAAAFAAAIKTALRGASVHELACPRLTQRVQGLFASQETWAFWHEVHAVHVFRRLLD